MTPLDYPILDLVTVPWHYRQEVRLRKKLHQVRVDEERPRGLGEFVLFPLLFTHSLRRSHVKCNVVAKPTITHRRLTHTRERGQKLENIVEQQTEPY